MSIVALKKITIYGCLKEKREILDGLQRLGCLHVTELNQREDLLDKKDADASLKILEALKHLHDCPQKLKQVKNSSNFDPDEIEQQILHNKQQIDDLQDEKDSIKHKIDELTPWGSFTLPNEDNLKFWFYIVPHREMKNLNLQTLCGEQVQKDTRFNYIVIISDNEPENIPGKHVKLPSESLLYLRERLEHIEFELENLHIERIKLTRWLELFKNNLFKLQDDCVLKNTFQKTYDTHPLFVLQGWIPSNSIEKLSEYAKKSELVTQIEEAHSDELPPTLLQNNSSLKGGEDLLSFYMTPNYWLWDPSTTIFFSFAIFFAMIFSDAGYAIILGSVVAFFWKRLGKTDAGKKFRNILLALTGFSLLWGILVGSYFGVSPPTGNYLSYLKIFDMNNYSAMMMLSVGVGIIHITIANLAQAWTKRNSLTAIAHIGWTALLIGAALTFFGIKSSEALPKTLGSILLFFGILAVVFFTSIEKPFWKRFLNGLMGLTRITGMFGDILSYLRLFALGLASASLAAVFNDLATQIYHSMPGFKLFFALLIVLIGHGINFILSLMSGFIHGLRLNFIEFFNWGLPEEGIPFKAFSKKEMSKWDR